MGRVHPWVGLGGLFPNFMWVGLDWVQICIGTVVTYSVFPTDCFHKLLTSINQLYSIVQFG